MGKRNELPASRVCCSRSMTGPDSDTHSHSHVVRRGILKTLVWPASSHGTNMAAAEPPEPPKASKESMLAAVKENRLDDVKIFLDVEKNKDFCNVVDGVYGATSLKDEKGLEPLMIAAIEGHAKMCEFLIRKRANLTCADQRGDTPLHRAVVLGFANVVEVLINKNAPLDARSKTGSTALHYSTLRGNRGLSELLLMNGANPNVFDEPFGNTPLHFAAMEGHVGIGLTLLNSRASMDSVNSFGDTPLHDAAGYGQANFCKMLLKRGANVLALSSTRKTPLMCATSRSYPTCVAIVEQFEAKAKELIAAEMRRLHELGQQRLKEVQEERERAAAHASAERDRRDRAKAETVRLEALAVEGAAAAEAPDIADEAARMTTPTSSSPRSRFAAKRPPVSPKALPAALHRAQSKTSSPSSSPRSPKESPRTPRSPKSWANT